MSTEGTGSSVGGGGDGGGCGGDGCSDLISLSCTHDADLTLALVILHSLTQDKVWVCDNCIFHEELQH